MLAHLRYLKREHKDKEALIDACRYIKNNQHRMKYAEAKSKGYPIGSGVVEACCKALVQHRLKRTGMSWRQPGGQSILTFRALVKSQRFDRAWKLIAEPFKKSFKPRNNVVAFPVQMLN